MRVRRGDALQAALQEARTRVAGLQAELAGARAEAGGQVSGGTCGMPSRGGASHSQELHSVCLHVDFRTLGCGVGRHMWAGSGQARHRLASLQVLGSFEVTVAPFRVHGAIIALDL